jgi:hypothetical protein
MDALSFRCRITNEGLGVAFLEERVRSGDDVLERRILLL